MNPTGNTILITGGTSGIGRALAERLHQRGNTVIVAGRNRAALDEITAAHLGIHGVVLDIADPASIAEAAARIKAEHPNLNILVVHRSDGSGTTFIFANYLSKVSQEWASSVGADTAIEWPVGVGGKGNEGVAGTVNQLAGSIGYVEYAYAMQNHMAYTKLINRSGKTLEPNIDTFRAGAAGADWVGAAGQEFNMVLVNQAGDNAWPITGATWAIMYKNPRDKAASAEALKFFKWAYENGDKEAISLQYVPLPENAVKAIEASWKGIAGSGL